MTRLLRNEQLEFVTQNGFVYLIISCIMKRLFNSQSFETLWIFVSPFDLKIYETHILERHGLFDIVNFSSVIDAIRILFPSVGTNTEVGSCPDYLIGYSWPCHFY